MLHSAGTHLGPEPWLGEKDVWLLREGRHLRPWEKLGAHPGVQAGVVGTTFAVWAPNAQRVAVVGDFNHWNIHAHVMQHWGDCGAWVLFVPVVGEGALYKFSVLGADGLQHFKTDPYAFCTEQGAGHAGVVMALPAPVAPPVQRVQANALSAPISIYEVHVGSWRRPQGHEPDWHDLAQTLVPYAVDMGFTHLELMPITEHPFYGSWGYQPTGLYAPSARYGTPQAFRKFIATAHAAGLMVLLDWVPAHFPGDSHALSRFDGTPQYEHADPREGVHRDWNTLIYNYGRNEVRNFLVGNALFWIERYGIDGLRVDAVASMLYRDYSRQEGEWIPNQDGGRENYEAIHFLREVNRVIGEEAPGAITLAEESTAFSGVTRPPWMGGLGFNFKWNLGWMHDTLSYFSTDPVHRKHHHDLISFAMAYAYSEHFVLPLSHDEVVHGKGSLVNKMWGDPWQKFANLRALYALMFGHPGRKLLFMGNELAQAAEWDHDAELDWPGLNDPQRAGVQRLVRDLNHLYRTRPALHARDDEYGGFSWVDVEDRAQSIYSFLRYGNAGDGPVVVVCNFTPVVRQGYRMGLPQGGVWHEVLNTDASRYGGSGVGNPGALHAESRHWQGQSWSVTITLPPLGVVWLEPEASS
jgi:1,4-alpha-glucan branching enzyme